jgi:hypothetical protein
MVSRKLEELPPGYWDRVPLETQFYAAYNKVTGLYLPPMPTKRGGTWLEPGKVPRIFTTRPAAKNALSWWLSGHFTKFYSTDPLTGDDKVLEKTEPVVGRIASEWEVVEMQLSRMEYIKI